MAAPLAIALTEDEGAVCQVESIVDQGAHVMYLKRNVQCSIFNVQYSVPATKANS
jgi:hypothetical protein